MTSRAYGLLIALLLATSSPARTDAQDKRDAPNPGGVGRQGTAESSPEPVKNTGHVMSTADILVVVPKSRASVAAYSYPRGTWDRVEFRIPFDEQVIDTVVVAQTFAAFRSDDSIYAFSAETAKWGRLKLPADTKASFIVGNHVQVTDRNRLYLFGHDARWSGIDLDTGEFLEIDD